MTDTTPADERHWTPINLVHLSESDLRHVRAYAEAYAEQARAASQPAQEPVVLQRFGVKWKGQTEPFMEQMPDGYWTPWHIANEALQRAAPLSDQARQDRIMELAQEWVRVAVQDLGDAECKKASKALEREVRKP